MAILAYASIEGQDHGWSSRLVSGAFILGVVALVGFVAWERHRTDSLLDVTLFARPNAGEAGRTSQPTH